MSELVPWDIEVSDRPVESARKGGPGRQRTNPFDKPLMESYHANFAERTAEHPKGRFMVIRNVPEDKVKSVVAQIRNAARYNNIGSRIDIGTGKDAGVIAFRGQVPTKGPNAPVKATDDNATVTNETVEYDNVSYEPDEDEQY